MNALLTRLYRMVRNERLPHGLCFEGPDPAEKLSAAHQLVKYLVCFERKDGGPCQRCRPCLKIERGYHPDFLTIEAEKKEIKIEQVRELQRWIQLAPHEARMKVGLIDMAETLNKASANALLKTLEEPPPHAVLLLLTRSSDALLPTVRSRLQVIRFSASRYRANLASGEPPPKWAEDLQRLVSRRSAVDPEEIFSLTGALAKQKEDLPIFFEIVEKQLREDLESAQRKGDPLARQRHLEEVFGLALRMEHQTLRRYANVGLALDRLLLRWLSAG